MKTIYYVLCVAGKEVRLIANDRGTLAILILLPIFLGSLFAGLNSMANSGDGNPDILLEVSLVNDDTGGFGGEIAKSLQSIEELNVLISEGIAEAEQRVIKGETTAAIIIPADFSEKINTYTPTSIEVIVDPAEPEASSIVTGIMRQVVGEVTIWGEIQYGVRTIMTESGVLR